MAIKTLRGTYDIYPPDSYIWNEIECKARELFLQYGYGEMRTPIFEETQLFTRSIGEETDIVSKEMYTFPDRKGRSLTLRPEGTAPVVRALLQHRLHHENLINKFFYIGPMFRYERPQAGRNRQFYQLGTEILGSTHPYYDAESIALAHHFLKKLGLSAPQIRINSVGDSVSKQNFSTLIRNELSGVKDSLCTDCQTRLDKNPLRVLDCKNPNCKEYIKKLPKLYDHLSPSSKNHFQQVCNYLKAMEIDYDEDCYLVRGLDYYTETIFEIYDDIIGSQDALGGGGRYNNLVKEMGGPDLGAVGFAFGIDRLVMTYHKTGAKLASGQSKLDLYILNLEPSVFTELVALVQYLRKKGIKADICTEEKSMKAQLRSANKAGARLVLIRGKEEVDRNEIIIKNMAEKTEDTITYTNKTSLCEHVRERITGS